MIPLSGYEIPSSSLDSLDRLTHLHKDTLATLILVTPASPTNLEREDLPRVLQPLGQRVDLG